MFRLKTGAFLTVLLCLISAVAADDDAPANRTRRQYGRRPVQHHSSRNPANYFEATKAPKPYNPTAHDYPIQYRPAYHADPILKTVIPPYHPVEEPKPYYPERKPAAGSYYPTAAPQKQAAYYPQVKPEYKEPAYGYDYCPKIAGLESQCRPIPDCAVWYDLVLASLPESACKLPNGEPGACCPDIPYNGRGGAFKVPKKEVTLYRNIDKYSLNAAAHAGRFNLRLTEETEKLLRANNITVRPSSAVATHLLFFQTTEGTRNISRGAYVGVETTKELGKRFELTADEAGFGLAQFNLRDTILSDTCPAEPLCDESIVRSPFRTADGSCNNLRVSSWGKSRTQFQRALVANYADGVWQPRRALSGSKLPSARLVSISIVPDIDAPHETNTLWVMQHGQFVDHDLTSTPVFRMNANGGGIQCCTEDGQFVNNTELNHPECFSIEIPDDDPFFYKFGQKCMSFVRSTPAPRLDCSFGHGEQMNQLTHYLDHSNVYGSDLDEAAALRTFIGGGLKVTKRKGHHELDLLPPDDNADMDCTLSKKLTGIDPPEEVKCFKAGDSRVTEQPDLAVTHTLFMRQHNLIAAELSYINPHWDDERLYQEARRILTAQMQHITYNEWLPIVIGRDKMQSLGMLPLQHGFSDDYDDSVNPSVLNEFATAAFRFGHSLIQGKVDLINQKRKKESVMLLRQHFFKTQIVYTPGNLDRFLIGLASQPIQEFDNYFTEEITNHLFEEEGKGFGMDLVALNLQRGRDHGIPGYNIYRTLCGLPKAHYFHDLLDLISPSIVERFELLYESVDDIDLFIAAVSERPAPGALVGPTFQCILADQFLRLKRGDRFFYDLAGHVGSFTEEQLNEIRKTSFARLICDNSNVYSAQPLAFKIDSPVNPIVDCKSPAIPSTNLLAWQEVYHKPQEPYKRPPPPPTHKYY